MQPNSVFDESGNAGSVSKITPYERAQELYTRISERLYFNGQAIKIVDETSISPDQKDDAILANKMYFNLASLLDEIAYQAAEGSEKNMGCLEALEEVGLMGEFVVQMAERNPGMFILSNTETEERYKNGGDNARFWFGDFNYGDKRVGFEIMVRPKSHEVFDDKKPGVLIESRQARLGINLYLRGSKKISIRLDLDSNICFDIEAPDINGLKFENVNQVKEHHFLTNIRATVGNFEKALQIYASVLDSFVNMPKSTT